MTARDVFPPQRTGPAGPPAVLGTPVTPAAPAVPAGLFGGLGVAGAVEDTDCPADVLDLLALDPFVTGREPFARTVDLEHVVPDADLLPPDARLLREAVDEHCVSRLAAGEGWSLLAVHWRQSHRARIVATAVSADLAERVSREARHGAVAEPEPTPERVTIGFWHLTPHGPRRIERRIDTEPWGRIRGNYTDRAARAVDALAATTTDGSAGRLLLLHGPPGTGKTTLLRSLAREWRSWCQVDCILDPEVLFGSPAYLLQIALGADEEDDEDDEDDGGDGRRAERWRLLLLEDCDELIRAEAKSSAGQALSRLLNLTDGLLGQGRKVLVAVTTNEDLATLHPAVTRPGRSLAHLEIGRLSPDEARTWLAQDRPADDVRLTDRMLREGATLAELYALRSGAAPVSLVEEPTGYGCYL